MEDLVYIILAVVWLAISILGGRKKKKQRQSVPQPEMSEPQPIEVETTTKPAKKSEFEDMLEDFFGTDKDKPKPEPKPKPEQVFQNENESTFDPPKRDKGGSIQTAPWTYMSEEKKKEFEGEVEKDFEFTAEGKLETLEDYIKAYEMTDKKTEEEAAKIAVVDLEEVVPVLAGLDFDPRKAIIYSEIINRKHFRI